MPKNKIHRPNHEFRRTEGAKLFIKDIADVRKLAEVVYGNDPSPDNVFQLFDRIDLSGTPEDWAQTAAGMKAMKDRLAALLPVDPDWLGDFYDRSLDDDGEESGERVLDIVRAVEVTKEAFGDKADAPTVLDVFDRLFGDDDGEDE